MNPRYKHTNRIKGLTGNFDGSNNSKDLANQEFERIQQEGFGGGPDLIAIARDNFDPNEGVRERREGLWIIWSIYRSLGDGKTHIKTIDFSNGNSLQGSGAGGRIRDLEVIDHTTGDDNAYDLFNKDMEDLRSGEYVDDVVIGGEILYDMLSGESEESRLN